MKSFFQTLLDEHSHLRKNPDYIAHSMDFILSLIRTEDGFDIDNFERPAIKTLFSVLQHYLHNLPNKTPDEMVYGMNCARIVANL